MVITFEAVMGFVGLWVQLLTISILFGIGLGLTLVLTEKLIEDEKHKRL